MNTIFNPALLTLVKELHNKAAFVDPAMAAGGMPADPAMAGGAPPGMPMDPAMMGGMPPMDPSMMGGMPPMDPAMAAGAPMDPSMGGMPPAPSGAPAGAAAGLTEERVRQIIQEAMGGAGGAKGSDGASGAKKPTKIDPGEEIYQLKKMMVTIFNTMGLQVPPDMLLRPEDREAGAEDASGGDSGGGGESAQAESAIKPIEAIQPASPELAMAGKQGASKLAIARVRSPGQSIGNTALGISDKAAALARIIEEANRAAKGA